MFLGYTKRVKAYKLWCLEPGHIKCIVSCDVVFNETAMAYKSNTDSSHTSTDQREGNENEKVDLEVRPQEKSEEVQVGDWLLEEVEADEEQHETNSCLFTRDKAKMDIRPPDIYGYADLIAFSLIADSKVLEAEPKSFKSSLANKE